MKKNKEKRCPCCSRHCPMDDLHCKHGKAYFARIEKGEKERERPRKWERHVKRGGAAWKLFLVSRSAKRALREGRIIESQVFGALTDPELSAMNEMLDKMLALSAYLRRS